MVRTENIRIAVANNEDGFSMDGPHTPNLNGVIISIELCFVIFIVLIWLDPAAKNRKSQTERDGSRRSKTPGCNL